MLDKNFWGLLESQLEALKISEDKDANIVLLETAKLILSNVDASAETLKSYDKFDIRELFAIYADVASSATDFFESNRELLDPAALSGSIGKKLEIATSEIASTKRSLETIKTTEKLLLENEEELLSLKKTYKELDAKISELKAVKDMMSPEIIEKMKSDVELYKIEVQKLEAEYKQIEGELKDLSEELSDIKTSVSNAHEDKMHLSNEMIAIISKHYKTLKMLFENHNKDVDELIASIKEYQDAYNSMENELSTYTDTLSIYEEYLGENSKIVESMKKYGVKSLNSALDDITRIKNTIDSDLAAYDLIIQKILIHEEDIRKELSRRQGKMI